MTTILTILAALGVAGALAYHRANGLAWSIALAAGAAWLPWATGTSLATLTVAWIAVGIFAALSVVEPLPPPLGTRPIFAIYKRILPHISQTEQEALDAGRHWWGAD